jgi:hypothetical protein
MSLEKNKDQTTILDDIDFFAAADTAYEEELQRLIGDITLVAEPRPLHYHFSHTTLPAYCADPGNLAKLQRIMSKGGEEQLISDLYYQTLKNYPQASPCFVHQEICGSRHTIPSSSAEMEDFPLLLFRMPPPRAGKETFLACLGLLPRQEFYHNKEWRYFVVDGSTRPGKTAETFLSEYFFEPALGKEGGFLPMVPCWPTIDALLENLTQKWDDAFYTL